nr:MAG: phospholipase [Hyphomicrobiales bacterium]
MAPPKIDGPRLAPASGSARQLVVFLHGYGADGNDLIALGRQWQSFLPDAAFVSPNAPEPCTNAPGRYQWFALARIDPNETERGTEAAAPTLEAFLNHELERLSLSPDKLALVGFSQGTMMALHVGLRRTIPPAAIVGYSGMVVAPERMPKFPNGVPPIYLQHGDQDQVIPVQALFLSAGALGAAGLPLQWRMAPGLGHGIDAEGLALGGVFLAGAFAGRLKPPCTPVCSSYPKT